MYLKKRRVLFCVQSVALLLNIFIGISCKADRMEAPTDKPSPTSLELVATVHHLDKLAYEPMVVEHPNGTLFVTGFGRVGDPEVPPQLWKSSDRGTTWERVNVGTSEEGAAGNSDPDLAVAPDGTLYFINLGVVKPKDPIRGHHIAVGASSDMGANWTWTRLSEGLEEDRPWIGVAPDGKAHAIWNDNRGGVSHAVSTDRGKTWIHHDRIHPVGGSSHLAVGPNGEVAVRIIPLSWGGYQFDEGVELIAVSTDGGNTWQKYVPPGNRFWIADWPAPEARTPETKHIDRWAETIAWDAAGALYYLWSEEQVLWLGRSLDQGKTWKSWPVVQDEVAMFYPYLVARDAGQLAALWLSGRGGPFWASEEELKTHVALIEFPAGSDAEPKVLRSKPFQGDTWYGSQESPTRSVGGDYLSVVLLSDGSVGAVTPIQNAQRDRWGFTWWRFEAR